MNSPVEHLSSLIIGTVESVAPDSIHVVLEPDAPQGTALNVGVPVSFPRIGAYVLLPNERGATVGYVAWIGIERSPYPKRSGLRDFGLVDLPFPLRKMKVVPAGTLITINDSKYEPPRYRLSRGVAAYPSVGDQVLLPTDAQQKAIIDGEPEDRRVMIGVAPLSGGAAVRVDPDKLFGRHLAVLGNTGSGKSCSVAGLVRWSLEAAQSERSSGKPNARFILLDPNGEYSKAFADLGDNVRMFRPGDDESPLSLPAWMWNSHEWAAVTNAQPGTQRPLLVQALRALRAGSVSREPQVATVVRQLRLYRGKLSTFLADGSGTSFTGFPGNRNAALVVENLAHVMASMAERAPNAHQQQAIREIADAAEALRSKRVRPGREGRAYYDDFTILDFEPLIGLIDAALETLPNVPLESHASEDAPKPFDVGQLADFVDDLSADGTSNANVGNFVAFLTLRIRSLLAERRLRAVVDPATQLTLADWLGTYIGEENAKNGQVAILDLSLIPSDTVHIVVAVLARFVFEALQRYRRRHPEGRTLPTVLVLEEAHTFVRRGTEEEGSLVSPARLCRETFEKIAREGRKFGLSLVISSQRPSELSQTVLAQCNTFLLHRLVNDTDQQLVSRLVPDNLAGLLKELPSLPSRQAILLGWAALLPVLVEMRELSESRRPRSEDPDFWKVWTGERPRAVDWQQLADEWVGGSTSNGVSSQAHS